MATMTYGAVVGENVKRLRLQQGLTQHELVWKWRACGLHWARSKLAALENGHRPKISGGELFIIAFVFDAWHSEMFAGDGDVELVPGAPTWPRDAIRALYRADI